MKYEIGSCLIIFLIGSIPGQLFLMALVFYLRAKLDNGATLKKNLLLAGYAVSVLPVLYLPAYLLANATTAAGDPVRYIVGDSRVLSLQAFNPVTPLMTQAHYILSTLAFIWLAGSLFALYQSRKQVTAFREKLMLEGSVISVQDYFTAVSDLSGAMTRQLKRLTLIRHPAVVSPFVLGCRRTFLLLPDQAFTAEQRNIILKHELTHLLHGDLWLKQFVSICRSLFFFNPLIRSAGRLFDEACEQSCDRSVVRTLTKEQRKDYGHLLLNILEKAQPAALLSGAAWSQDKNLVRQRLRLVMNPQKSPPARRAAQVAAATLGVLVALSAMVFVSGQAIGIEHERMILADLGYAPGSVGLLPTTTGRSDQIAYTTVTATSVVSHATTTVIYVSETGEPTTAVRPEAQLTDPSGDRIRQTTVIG